MKKVFLAMALLGATGSMTLNAASMFSTTTVSVGGGDDAKKKDGKAETKACCKKGMKACTGKEGSAKKAACTSKSETKASVEAKENKGI